MNLVPVSRSRTGGTELLVRDHKSCAGHIYYNLAVTGPSHKQNKQNKTLDWRMQSNISTCETLSLTFRPADQLPSANYPNLPFVKS